MEFDSATTLGSGAKCPVPECCIPIDIILVSCDRQEFGAHQSNLANFSGGFPQPTAATNGVPNAGAIERVDMAENGSPLKLLLQFMHHRPQPDLSSIAPTLLADLAEAAEKYVVFSAMPICKASIENRIHIEPVLALSYAAKHGHRALADRAAKKALEKNLTVDEFLQKAFQTRMLERDIIKWMAYRAKYAAAVDGAFRFSREVIGDDCCDCAHWPVVQAAVLHTLSASLMSVMQFEQLINNLQLSKEHCLSCDAVFDEWITCVVCLMPGDSHLFSDIAVPPH